MLYGTERTTVATENFSVTEIKKINKGEPYKVLKSYKIRVAVKNAQEEMTEFIRFTDEIRKKRQQGKLTIDLHDPSTFPAFIIEYPKNDQGSYFVIKTYSIIDKP